jgi:murein hydrolase activator
VRPSAASLALVAALAFPAARATPSEAAPAGAADPRAPAVRTSDDAAPGPAGAMRSALARQLSDEIASAERAIAAVADKLAAAAATRARRLAAAYRLLRDAGSDADRGADSHAGDATMATARIRAAAQLLVERDTGERDVLAAELAQLRAARDRIAGELAQVPSIALPGELARPAPGKIARRFGTLEHERSRATLSRRGIDLEVEERSHTTAPAAGTVRYAGPIRGLDHGVLLDHGSYVTVIAKLGEIALPVGTVLAAGDRLGRAARHRVYFEVRVKLGPGGHPVDPEPLLR